jgi:hypothetical protein
MQVLWTEMGLPIGSDLDAATWESFMVQFIRRQAERDANMFVVVPSTPSQYFHVLRRQANLPYKRPLICLARSPVSPTLCSRKALLARLINALALVLLML